ncbi:ABC transporter ATP-binding protein [Methylomonas sp. AM2-LC]|uniref:ABC transporter ATP-binding protein n=1 Tax=Methylomonas sp. AM2-LC TaxID=3153301 RepID=UPI0032677892
MPNIAITAKQLVKWFGEGEARTNAVKEVSFEIRYGEAFFLVGPSGSGKTTLLSMMSGILRPNSGSVLIDNTDIWSLDNDALADFRLNRIGFVFQDYHLFPRLSTVENVAIPLILKRRNWDEAIQEALKFLDIVGLKDRAQLPPVKLSGGEQQRVAIARAMVSQPDILIFDEPTASLDGESGKKIMAFVKSDILNEKRCVLVVSHDNRIFEFADRIMKMEDGQVTAIEKQGLAK